MDTPSALQADMESKIIVPLPDPYSLDEAVEKMAKYDGCSPWVQEA